MKSIKYRDLYINVTLSTIFLSSPCLILNEFSTQTGINLSFINILIFINLFAVFYQSSNTIHIFGLPKITNRFLIIISVYLILLWITLYEANIIGAGPRSFIKAIIIILLVSGVLNSSMFNLKSFNNFFINVAFVFSIFSIILFVGYSIGLLTVKWGYVVGYGTTIKGLGGYLGTSSEVYQTYSGIQIRAQSYFSEPTNFAQFLIIPFFFTLQKIKNKRDPRTLVKFITIGSAYLLTFSIANFAGLFFALILYAIYFSKFQRDILFSKYKRPMLFVAGVLLLFIGFKVNQAVNQTAFTTVIAKGENIAVPDRIDRNNVVLTEILNNPFGNYEFRERVHDNSGLLGFTLITGGFPLLLIVVVFMLKFYSVIFKAAKFSKNSILYLGAIAYLIPAIWDAQFVEYYFMFHIVLFSLIIKKDLRGEYLI